MFNKVILVGNLTRAPELKYTSGKGTPLAKTGIAVNRRVNVNGEMREEVCFVDLTFWGRYAEVANQYLTKGSKVMIEGRLMFEQWQDANGQNRSKHTISVESMEMLDSKERSQNAGNYDNSGYGSDGSYGGGYGSNQNFSTNQQGYGANQQNYGAQRSYNQNSYQQNGSYQQNSGGYQQNSGYQNNNFAQNSTNNFANNGANMPQKATKQAPAQEKLPEYDVDKDEIPF